MKNLRVSIFLLLAVSCSFESSQFVCESDEEGTKNAQGWTCVNGIWVASNTVDDRDIGFSDTPNKEDASSKSDSAPTSDVETDVGTCPEGLIECENECVNTTTSASHCGGCGMRCDAGELCNAGDCKSECEAPTPDLCENTCVDTTNNLSYCGDCNTKCPARAGSNPVCDSSSCGFICDDGLADCDLRPNNGCEVDLRDDPLNCGACGNPGIPETCDGIDNDCNGIKDDGPQEICDGIDNDCDSKVDEGCPDGVVTGAADFGAHAEYGDATGGSAFSDLCPNGEALYRFTGNVEGNIDRLRGHCASLVFETNTTSTPYRYSISRGANSGLPRHGQYNTKAFDLTCPQNAFAVGLIVNHSNGIHAVGLNCAALIVSENGGVYSIEYDTISKMMIAGTNTGTEVVDALSAPYVVGSIRGRSGGYIDALGIGEKMVTLTIQ